MDEDVEIGVRRIVAGANRSAVRPHRQDWWEYELVATNAQPNPVARAEFEVEPRRFRPSRRLFERDGMRVWRATIPPTARCLPIPQAERDD